MSANRYTVSVLIVDDSPEDMDRTLEEVKSFFSEISSSELNIKTASSAPEMLDKVRDESFHIVLLDHELGLDPIMQPIHGVDFIPAITELQPNTRVIMVTSHKSTRLSSKAIQNGAYDFVEKDPSLFEDRKKIFIAALKEARFELEMERRNLMQEQVKDSDYQFKSQAMKALDEQLKSLAEVQAHVLFIGEPGLGKTHSAKRLSSLMAKHKGLTGHNFQNININSTPDNLQASALFGHSKGAFTGATEDKKGLIELAENGCLFLDEIGDASLEVQALLLKVVDERIYQRVGGKGMLKANTRFIFATNRDLEKMVRLGTFRKDLYDRISAIVIKMPSQRDRKVDIPFICQSMTDRLKEENGKNINYNDFPQDLKDYLTSGEIEGNIRGIENHLIKLMSLSKTLKNGKLDYAGWKEKFGQNKRLNSLSSAEINKSSIQDLIDALASKVEDSEWPGLPNLKKIIEKKMVQKVHEKSDDNKVRAKLLGISLQSIYQKNDKYIKG